MLLAGPHAHSASCAWYRQSYSLTSDKTEWMRETKTRTMNNACEGRQRIRTDGQAWFGALLDCTASKDYKWTCLRNGSSARRFVCVVRLTSQPRSGFLFHFFFSFFLLAVDMIWAWVFTLGLRARMFCTTPGALHGNGYTLQGRPGDQAGGCAGDFTLCASHINQKLWKPSLCFVFNSSLGIPEDTCQNFLKKKKKKKKK